jgi:hypothetical protein
MTSASEETSRDLPAPAGPGGPLRAFVRGLDAWVRGRGGFVEFSDSPACVLRGVVGKAEYPVRLSDGVVVAVGQTILDVHFWNERIPPASGRLGLGWGGQLGRRLLQSFAELALAIQIDPRIKDAVAIRGRLPFDSGRGPEETHRFGAWFGLESAGSQVRISLARRAHDLIEDLWLLALAWTYNPSSLEGRSLLRRRDDLWMSKETLIARHAHKAARRGGD